MSENAPTTQIEAWGPCTRCGWIWPKRAGQAAPLRCTNKVCRSPYWDRPKTRKTRPGKPGLANAGSRREQP